MGFDVWVARNDLSREVGGQKFSEHFRLKDSLPLQFDEATTRTIEYIDVLWLQKNAIVAAFEVESTTSIYSGLLRMSDLVSMQPNLKHPALPRGLGGPAEQGVRGGEPADVLQALAPARRRVPLHRLRDAARNGSRPPATSSST